LIGTVLALLMLPGLAETPSSSSDMELDVEVLSVSVSELAKNSENRRLVSGMSA